MKGGVLNSFHNPLKQYLCNSGYMSSEFLAVAIQRLNNVRTQGDKAYKDVAGLCSLLPIGVSDIAVFSSSVRRTRKWPDPLQRPVYGTIAENPAVCRRFT
jgi:hypothetical protein